MTFSDEQAIIQLNKVLDIMEALNKLGFKADVIKCPFDNIPILKVRARKTRKEATE